MNRLRERLDELHEELSQTESVDAESRKALVDVLDDIRELLERNDEGASKRLGSLSQRLSDTTHEFEESHPKLAEALGRVVDALANLGI